MENSNDNQSEADKFEAEAIEMGFNPSDSSEFSFVTFSSNNFGQKTDTKKAEE